MLHHCKKLCGKTSWHKCDLHFRKTCWKRPQLFITSHVMRSCKLGTQQFWCNWFRETRANASCFSTQETLYPRCVWTHISISFIYVRLYLQFIQWSLLLATDLNALFYIRKQVLLVLYKGNFTEQQGNSCNILPECFATSILTCCK